MAHVEFCHTQIMTTKHQFLLPWKHPPLFSNERRQAVEYIC